MNVVALPVEVLRLKILPFLTLDGLVRLDSAIHNKKWRRHLLLAVNNCALSANIRIVVYFPMVNWFVLKELSLSRVAFCQHINASCILKMTDIIQSTTSVELVWCNKPDYCRRFQPTHSDGTITSTLVTHLVERCSNLRELTLSGYQRITDAAIFSIAHHCRGLLKLEIGGCSQITDNAINELATHCPALQILHIGGCYRISDEGIISLATHCVLITKLNISGCPFTTDDSLVVLAQHCTLLQVLEMSDCFRVTDIGVIAIATHCTLLCEVNLNRCTRITDAAVSALALHCPSVRTLRLSMCTGITNAAVTDLSLNCAQLTELNLAGCANLTDTSIVQLAHGCALQALDISDCELLTDVSLLALRDQCPQLVTVDFSGCELVTPEVVSELSLLWHAAEQHQTIRALFSNILGQNICKIVMVVCYLSVCSGSFHCPSISPYQKRHRFCSIYCVYSAA